MRAGDEGLCSTPSFYSQVVLDAKRKEAALVFS